MITFTQLMTLSLILGLFLLFIWIHLLILIANGEIPNV